MIRADDKGKFSMKIYGDFRYEIQGECDECEGGKSGKGERVRVPITTSSKPFKLVIKPE
jgi:hypothetical protein